LKKARFASNPIEIGMPFLSTEADCISGIIDLNTFIKAQRYLFCHYIDILPNESLQYL
jgi:hypothetical protein